jgi:uncharacterized membrane protein YphA (DoxX/SURF4 family)
MGILILRWVCIILLAAVFLYSGYSKMQSTLQFAAVLAQYGAKSSRPMRCV